MNNKRQGFMELETDCKPLILRQLVGKDFSPCEMYGSLESLIDEIADPDSEPRNVSENVLRLLLFIEQAPNNMVRAIIVGKAIEYVIMRQESFRKYLSTLLTGDWSRMDSSDEAAS